MDLATVPGTGHAGRVTKQDILGFIDGHHARGGRGSAPASAPPRARRPTRPRSAPRPAPAGAASAPSDLWKTLLPRGAAPRVPGAGGRPGRAHGQDPSSDGGAHGAWPSGSRLTCTRSSRSISPRSIGSAGAESDVGGAGRPRQLHRVRGVGLFRVLRASTRW